MSYDYAVWYEPEPISSLEGRAKYLGIMAGHESLCAPHPQVTVFANWFFDVFSELNFRRPPLSDKRSFVALHLVFDTRAESVFSVADSCDLVVYDDQSEGVRLPLSLTGSCVMQLSNGRRVFSRDLESFWEEARRAIDASLNVSVYRRNGNDSLDLEFDDDFYRANYVVSRPGPVTKAEDTTVDYYCPIELEDALRVLRGFVERDFKTMMEFPFETY